MGGTRKLLFLSLIVVGAAALRPGRAADAGPPDAGVAKAGAGETTSTPADAPLVETPAPPLPKLSPDDGRGLRVVVVPIHGTIEPGLSAFVHRALEESQGAALIVLDVDTLGGRVDAAISIRDALLSARVPTLAFVNRRAISAGALISLATDYIVFTPGGSMGAATPIQIQGGEASAVGEKMVSYMRTEMRATAEAKKRRGDIAEAMVDADLEVPGISPKGKLLTAATELALKIGLANAELRTLDDVLEAVGLRHAEVIRTQLTWAEKIARFLTDPIVSGLLMSIGILGLMIEFYTPGFGVAGAAGLLCLALFFGGHAVTHLAGWEELLIFALGIGLLAAEIFLIPGFGVAGVTGIALILVSLVMALTGLPITTSWSTGALTTALMFVAVSVGGAMVAMLVLMKVLPKQRFFGRWLILETTLGQVKNAAAPPEGDWKSSPSRWAQYQGQSGVAITDLRLAGKARLGDEVVDVVSQVDYIEAGTRVRVVRVEGVRVVVVRDDGAKGGDTA